MYTYRSYISLYRYVFRREGKTQLDHNLQQGRRTVQERRKRLLVDWLKAFNLQRKEKAESYTHALPSNCLALLFICCFLCMYICMYVCMYVYIRVRVLCLSLIRPLQWTCRLRPCSLPFFKKLLLLCFYLSTYPKPKAPTVTRVRR